MPRYSPRLHREIVYITDAEREQLRQPACFLVVRQRPFKEHVAVHTQTQRSAFNNNLFCTKIKRRNVAHVYNNNSHTFTNISCAISKKLIKHEMNVPTGHVLLAVQCCKRKKLWLADHYIRYRTIVSARTPDAQHVGSSPTVNIVL